MHTEHLLNEYCTPEYSAPQLIVAITCLPAPVMDDAACDLWSLGVIMFQLLVSTVCGPQVTPFVCVCVCVTPCVWTKPAAQTVYYQHDYQHD